MTLQIACLLLKRIFLCNVNSDAKGLGFSALQPHVGFIHCGLAEDRSAARSQPCKMLWYLFSYGRSGRNRGNGKVYEVSSSRSLESHQAHLHPIDFLWSFQETFAFFIFHIHTSDSFTKTSNKIHQSPTLLLLSPYKSNKMYTRSLLAITLLFSASALAQTTAAPENPVRPPSPKSPLPQLTSPPAHHDRRRRLIPRSHRRIKPRIRSILDRHNVNHPFDVNVCNHWYYDGDERYA